MDDKKTKLIAIGFLGSYKVYINLSRKDAIERHKTEEPNSEINELTIREMNIQDSFGAYDIWAEGEGF